MNRWKDGQMNRFGSWEARDRIRIRMNYIKLNLGLKYKYEAR